MIVLLPVSRFRVPYDLARGKPYSRLEHMVLNAIADGGASLRSLGDAFRVHDRLLVEAVVTLVNAGWVAVQGGSQASFVLTGAGHAAASGDHEPVSVVVEAARPGIVVMERHSGQVARQTEARPYRREDLAEVWDTAPRIRARIVRDSVDEAQVQKLLHREAGEWVRRVGRIEEISRDAHWLPLDVDVEAKRVLGIPPPWRHALTTPALAAAAAFQGELHEPATPRREGRPSRRRFLGVTDDDRVLRRATTVLVTTDDVLLGEEAHATTFNAALESARTSVALAIPSVDGPDDFEALASACADAVSRGIQVDLLVGASGADPTQLTAIANRIGYAADAGSGRKLLRTRVTGSGASLLLWDSEPGQLVGIVTDHRWTRGGVGSARPLGVRTRNHALCADLARSVASLWAGRGDDGDFAGEPGRWRRLAEETEEDAARATARPSEASVEGTATTAELLLDEECLATDEVAATDAAVGLYVPDPAGGDGGRRGVQLVVRGPGAQLLLAPSEASG